MNLKITQETDFFCVFKKNLIIFVM